MSLLAKALLSYDRRFPKDDEPSRPAAVAVSELQEVLVDGRTWAKWIELARLDAKKPRGEQ